MKELKPYPFCGGEAEMRHGLGLLEIDGSFCVCTKCGAIGQKFQTNPAYCADDKATEAWNRRAEE